MDKEKIYIIGAGLAGLSAAHTLAKSGKYDIAIYEASPHPGGRCRSYYDEKLLCEIDNGNHLIMGANTNTLELINELGTKDRFNEFTDKTFRFYNAKTGAKYIFKAPYPSMQEFKFKGIAALARFLIGTPKATVAQSFREADDIYRKLINPISRSILNTPSEIADSGIFKNVLKKIIQTRNGFYYYYPKINWNNALIAPILQSLAESGVEIHYDKRLKEVITSGDNAQKLVFDNEEIDVSASKIIIATPAQVAGKLLNITVPDKFEPIINIHFKINHGLKASIYGVIDGNIEWVFVKPNMISTTYSAGSDLKESDSMAKNAWKICASLLQLPEEIPPYRILIEKRATFTCEISQLVKRPKQKSIFNNIYLAGDYVDLNIPATIEGAILSGKLAASLALEE